MNRHHLYCNNSVTFGVPAGREMEEGKTGFTRRRWEIEDGRWEMGDGRWEMGDGSLKEGGVEGSNKQGEDEGDVATLHRNEASLT